MNFYPKAETRHIVQQDAGDELLLYNLKTNQAYYLNETAALVYQACDGFSDVQTIALQTGMSSETVELSLNKLSRQNLLTEPIEFSLSKRRLLKSAALTAALPIITMLIAPSAINALSACGTVAPNDRFTIPNDGGGTSSCFTSANDAVCASCRVGAASCATVRCDEIFCTCR